MTFQEGKLIKIMWFIYLLIDRSIDPSVGWSVDRGAVGWLDGLLRAFFLPEKESKERRKE